ncbi:hypothetical protein MKW92_036874 [Papaver armeniacum]|nr:hypothetical protein MKW92_036874 [Papaver armeniacum]
MSDMKEEENLEFKWLKKRGIGGRRKEVQFYDSFVFDGEEYSLYDCVYLYKDGEPEPYIGKLIKIWEQPGNLKKVKVLWFFRPIEVVNYIGDEEVPENELFLASGKQDSRGLTNINPLEVIAGKCNVICTSKDVKNPQPSEEEMKAADYIFYRTFNVDTFKISDKIDEKIASIEGTMGSALEDVSTSKVVVDSHVQEKATLKDVKPGEKKKRKLSNGNPSKPAVSRCTEKETNTDDQTVEVGKRPETVSALEDMSTSKSVVDSHVQEKATLTDVKAGEKKKRKLSNGNPSKPAVSRCTEKETNTDDQTVEVGKRPETVSALEDMSTSKSVVDSHVQEKATLTDVKAGEKKKHKLSNGNPSKPAVSRCTEKETNTDDQTVEVGKRPETVSALEDMSTSKAVVDSHVQEKATLTDVKPGEKKKRKLSNGNPSKPAVSRCTEKETNTDDKTVEVGRRPQTDRSKWFKGLPWEERMETAHDQGTLVLLENLDPSYTSAEVEDIIWHGFQENCTAKVVAQTAISSPHSGRAYVIFKTRDAAELAIEKLDAGCLMLPNGRPLVASRGNPPKRGKASTLVGHLFIEKIKLQTQREDIKKAVSTSHCSQPNTVEYEMALEWCLLQTRADKYWKELYKQQGEEMRKLRAELKFK